MAIGAYSQTICEEVMSAVPDNSGFIFRIAVFFISTLRDLVFFVFAGPVLVQNGT